MNHPNWIYSVSIAVLCAYGVVASHAAQNAPTFMSKDGQIQSVNKYSSNPFWSPNSPYNQRIPTPIYATGPDLTTGDCNTVVKTLVASHCAARNNCTDLRISDVRPNIMVQLSQLPGHSYATSCGGYIDSAFENYKKTYGNVSAVNIVYSGNNKANNTLRLTPATYTPTETETRTAELERLQKETTPGAGIDATLFPKTVDDLSFTDRLANTTAGYEPYKNKSSYVTPMFETESEYYDRMKPLLEHQITYMNAGVANGCPKTYMTGRGATVSCVPTRDPRSEFVSWCLDAKLTNCAQEYIISPTDRDDKVFYAKWDCISNSVKRGDKCECTDPHMNQYCECTGIYTTDPSDATRCACANGENPANNCGTPQITPPSPPSGGCSDPTYMDSNCQCTVVPNSHIDTTTGKCVCDNGNDISTNCTGTTPPDIPIPQCIHNMENDAMFKALGSVGNFELWLQNNKTTFYDTIGKQIVRFCLKANTALLREFNSFLDNASTINIAIPGQSTVSMPIQEVFDYVDFPTAILVSHIRNGVPATDIKKADISTEYFFKDACSDHSVRFGSDSGTAINQAGKAASYPSPMSGGYTFFLDMPKGKSTRLFPGLLLVSQNGFGGAENVVIMTNYLAAREKIKTFSDALNNSACSDDRLATYMVKLPVNISRQQSNDTKWYQWINPIGGLIHASNFPKLGDISNVTILEGPYIIR